MHDIYRMRIMQDFHIIPTAIFIFPIVTIMIFRDWRVRLLVSVHQKFVLTKRITLCIAGWFNNKHVIFHCKASTSLRHILETWVTNQNMVSLALYLMLKSHIVPDTKLRDSCMLLIYFIYGCISKTPNLLLRFLLWIIFGYLIALF